MSLQEKVLRLKLEGALAVRHARWWEKQIQIHGEDKATAFYTSLGLNHIEKKGYEWEGLTLSREPTEAEKLCVKGIAQVQENSKEKLITLLTQLRADLISDGLEGIRKLKPSAYHELTLSASPESRERLRDRLINVYQEGRLLVAVELGQRKEAVEGEFDDLDELTDLTDARVANDVQSRISAAATRFRLLGLTDNALIVSVTQEMADGSVSYIDRAATGLANRVISIGRGDEMRARSDDIERYEYSAILDQNTCPPCSADDGKEASSPDELPDTPNPECEGSDFCRCFIVAIAEGDM